MAELLRAKNYAIKIFEAQLKKGGKEFSGVFKAAMLGLMKEMNPQEARKWLFIEFIKIMNAKHFHISRGVANEITAGLAVEAVNMKPEEITKIAEDILINIDANNPEHVDDLVIELMLALIDVIGCSSDVTVSCLSVPGVKYREEMLTKLLTCSWPPYVVLPLVVNLKSMALTSEQLKMLVDRAIMSFDLLNTIDVPGLAYQLLLLSKMGHKREIVEGILSFGNRLATQIDYEENGDLRNRCHDVVIDVPLASARNIQSTVLSHMFLAAKLDSQLGEEVLRYLKVQHQSVVLQPFNISTAVILINNDRFKAGAVEVIRDATFHYYYDQAQCAESAWAHNTVTLEEGELLNHFTKGLNSSASTWDQVSLGLVQIGFALLQSNAKELMEWKKVDEFSKICERSELTPRRKSCKLGEKILVATFQSHTLAGKKIVQDVCNKIMKLENATVLHLIDILATLIRVGGGTVMQCQRSVEELIQNMLYLPASVAERIVEAVQGIFRSCPYLLNSCIMVLRKGLMFSKSVQERTVAVRGFLAVLKHLNVRRNLTNSQISQAVPRFSSQVQVASTQSQVRRNSNEAICLEIVGNLRRSLGQQAEVRATLYENLYDVVLVNNNLAKPVIEFLIKQFLPLYEEDESLFPPLLLNKCLVTDENRVFLAEPVSALLGLMVRVIFIMIERRGHDMGQDEDDLMCTQEQAQLADKVIEEMLDSLGRRLAACDIQDFELEKTSEFNINTLTGQKNTLIALLLIGVFEVTMEYIFTCGDYESTSCELVLQVFQKHQLISGLLKEKSSGKIAKQAGPKSMLSLRFHVLMSKALYNDNIPSHQESLKCLREHPHFGRFILTSTLSQLEDMYAKGSCDGPEGHTPGVIFKHLCRVGRVYFKAIGDYLNKDPGEEENKEVLVQIVQCFTTTMNIVCRRFREGLSVFLAAIDTPRPSGSAETLDMKLKEFLTKLQRCCARALEHANDSREDREIIMCFLSTLGELGRLCQADADHEASGLEIIKVWLQQVCKEHEYNDVTFVKCLLSHLLQLSSCQEDLVPLLILLAKDVHCVMGDISKNKPLDGQINMALVTPRTACPTVLLLITKWMNKELDDVAWLINFCKAKENWVCGKGESSSVAIPEERLKACDGFQVAICIQLANHLQVLTELIQSAVSSGWEGALQVTTKFYATFHDLLKLSLFRREKLNRGDIPDELEQLIAQSSVKVTQNVYAMITYLQTWQMEVMTKAAETKTKKGKKRDGATVVGKSRIMKESKCIPSLIFAIELYENQLIQLDKCTKTNLMDHFRLSTCRDFRIQTDLLMEEESDEDDDGETTTNETQQGEGDNDGSEPLQEVGAGDTSHNMRTAATNSQPPAKRQKSDRAKYKKMSDAY